MPEAGERRPPGHVWHGNCIKQSEHADYAPVLRAATLSELSNGFSYGLRFAEITNGYALFRTVQGSGPVREVGRCEGS
jgi:hypothetical protein